MPFLTTPAERYRDSFLAALREFQAEGRHANLDPDRLAADFGAFVRGLLARADRANVPSGRVPETVFWLIDGDDGEFIGRVSLRHELNDSLRLVGGHIGYEIRPSRRRRGHGRLILALALEEARARGLGRVLVTCDADNTGSKRIIEANGGQLEDAVTIPGDPTAKLRYWIAL